MTKINYLLAVPLKLEMIKLIESFESFGHQVLIQKDNNKNIHTVKKNTTTSLIITQLGHGKVNFAVGLTDLLCSFKNKIKINGVFCIGSSGALIDNLTIGDIILGEATVEHDYNTLFIETKLPTFKSNSELLKAILNADLKPNNYSVHQGLIASGDEDIITKNRACEIHKKTNAIVTAWEGAGGAKACQHLQVPFMEIRVVTDHCNEHSEKDFTKNLTLGMRNLADYFLNIK